MDTSSGSHQDRFTRTDGMLGGGHCLLPSKTELFWDCQRPDIGLGAVIAASKAVQHPSLMLEPMDLMKQ